MRIIRRGKIIRRIKKWAVTPLTKNIKFSEEKDRDKRSATHLFTRQAVLSVNDGGITGSEVDKLAA